MSAHVRAMTYDGSNWQITVARDSEMDIDRTEPPVEDLPEEIAEALLRWVWHGEGSWT